jgi:hypothetical protein
MAVIVEVLRVTARISSLMTEGSFQDKIHWHMSILPIRRYGSKMSPSVREGGENRCDWRVTP